MAQQPKPQNPPSIDDMTRKLQDAQAGQVQTIQLLGVPPDLVSDLRDMLRKLPHVEVDHLLKRLATCQILDVQVKGQPGA